MNISLDDLIRPVGYDRLGPKYHAADVRKVVMKQILIDDYFHLRGKKMADDITKATEIVGTATKELSESLDRFFALEERFGENAKRVTGRIRDASTRVAEGIARVEKAADLKRLERHCEVLEKMAESLERLAELESSGKLRKISEALT